ncbi:hypothetical protein FXO38_23979 [Capsicum annuum]|uniref:Uncharacterized protein n=1 Tax=Capsicum annuum TaxID=4072 RepID=A0A2G2Y385_CAPAN|nr:hypothetical protein FXO38_23979 [Capsicum annuum]PHT64202.1 hypothetical protein T459_31872 [Capsicum annuum]
MVQGSRQWHEKLSFALLGYRTTVRTSTGETPYLLVYGIEAVIPAEVEIPSLRFIVEVEIDDDEWVKTRMEHLSLIKEKKLTSVCHGQLYQRRMARAYNKKVRLRNFEVSQLVLRRILPHQVEAKGKFSPNWQGSFVVKKVLLNGALYLTDIEGKMAEMAINADAVKRYYAVGFVEAFRFGKRVHLRGMVKWKPIVRVKTHFPQSGSGSMMRKDKASVSDLGTKMKGTSVGQIPEKPRSASHH